MGKYEIGQEVRMFSINNRPPKPEGQIGHVEKIGRTLVHVRLNSWETTPFRIDTGVINDNYGHGRILTLDELADRDRRAHAVRELKEYGLVLDDFGRCPRSTDELVAVVDLLHEIVPSLLDGSDG